MKKGFTLAEVLITLGIIGIVAALTIPTLISKYQNHVLYNQFRKAASVMENAINQYNYENSCEEKLTVDSDGTGSYYDMYNNLCIAAPESSPPVNYAYLGDKLGSKFNVAQWITYENNADVCKNYKNTDGQYICSQEATSPGDIAYKNGYGFITTDNILIIPYDDASLHGYIDINGPNKKPNKYGKDIFGFSLDKPVAKIWWGYGIGVEDEPLDCENNRGLWSGACLLQEGKMNY